MILQGRVEGGRRKGRQKKRWEDNISEWTGLGLGEALRKAEDREEWRKVVARSSLMLQRSFRLRDERGVKDHRQKVMLGTSFLSSMSSLFPNMIHRQQF